MSEQDSKRYYWLKLKKDFFQQHQLKVLKSLPNGRLYALIYLELLAESTSHNGELRFSKALPYDSVTLSSVIDEDKDNLEKAIDILEKLELIEILEDKTIYLREIQKLIGSETGQTIRKREALVKSTTDLPLLYQKNTPEIRDKSKEIRDKNKKHIYGTYENVKLTLEEREKLENEYGNIFAEELINYLDEYIEMKGYKAKSHYLCIKKWVVDAIQEKKGRQSRIEKNSYTDIKPSYENENNDVSTDELERFLKERNSNEKN